jgi:hypothetical protein
MNLDRDVTFLNSSGYNSMFATDFCARHTSVFTAASKDLKLFLLFFVYLY